MEDALSGPTDFTIGSDVFCSDGTCGELRRVVVDPVARVLTHGSAAGHL
jgi:hypothetical protein